MENESISETRIREIRKQVEDRRHRLFRTWDKDFVPGFREFTGISNWITGLAAGAILLLSNAVLGLHVQITSKGLRVTLAVGFIAFVLTVILGVITRLAMLHVFSQRIQIGLLQSKGESAQDQEWFNLENEIERNTKRLKIALTVAGLGFLGTYLSFAIGIILTSIVVAVMFFR